MENLLNTQLKFATNLTTQLSFGKRNKQLNFLITQLNFEKLNTQLNFQKTQYTIFILHILQETARLSVCARQMRGSILRNFCRLVAYLCCGVSLRQ